MTPDHPFRAASSEESCIRKAALGDGLADTTFFRGSHGSDTIKTALGWSCPKGRTSRFNLGEEVRPAGMDAFRQTC